jgi:hypothetical protein
MLRRSGNRGESSGPFSLVRLVLHADWCLLGPSWCVLPMIMTWVMTIRPCARRTTPLPPLALLRSVAPRYVYRLLVLPRLQAGPPRLAHAALSGFVRTVGHGGWWLVVVVVVVRRIRRAAF